MVVVGIDLGTTYSCIALFQDGKVNIIPNEEGKRMIASCVSFADGQRLVGDSAKEMMSTNPKNTIYDTKRMIGRSHEELQADRRHRDFEVVNESGRPKIQVEYRQEEIKFLPEEISAMILGKLKDIAEEYLSEKVDGVVITVPARFNDAQRRATKDAAAIAQLNVLGMIDEPTAAALAYSLQEISSAKRNVVVFDFGGGTFDVTVLVIDGKKIKVMATSGNSHLGGQDFDNRILGQLLREIIEEHDVDIENDDEAMGRLKKASERVKMELSTALETKIRLHGICGNIDFSSSMDRLFFEQLNIDLFESTMETVEDALSDAGLNADEIDEVLLVGGSTRMPKVQIMLKEYFGEGKVCKTVNPQEAVAYGAAVKAAMLSNDQEMKERSSLSLEEAGEAIGDLERKFQKQCCQDETRLADAYYLLQRQSMTEKSTPAHFDGNKCLSIGIHLGTNFSCVAVKRNDQVEIVENYRGNRTTPSCIAFTEQEELVGDEAKENLLLDARNTVYDVKRMIGRDYTDKMLKEDMKRWQFKVVPDGSKPKVKITFRKQKMTATPEYLSSRVLKKMKGLASERLGVEVKSAVITVPAYFNLSQRKATKDAAKLAGLEVLGLINEPTAAAFAYGLHENISSRQNILVYDLGREIFDVTVVGIENRHFHVKASGGDSHLGGQDFTNNLFALVLNDFKKKHGKLKNAEDRERLREKCEKVKIDLSSMEQKKLSIHGLSWYRIKKYEKMILRATFEDQNDELFKKTFLIVDDVLKDAGMTKAEIDKVIAVGGSTRIPRIKQLLKEHFGSRKVCADMIPNEVYARGGVEYAAFIGKRIDSKIISVKERTPLSLGVGIKGDIMSFVIKRNSPLPCKNEKEFTTVEDYQTSVVVRVYEGERDKSTDNHFIGILKLLGIREALAGQVRVVVRFEIDEERTALEVTATDRDTNESAQTTISFNDGFLSDRELEELVQEAQSFEKEDMKWRQKTWEMNDLQSSAYEARRTLREMPSWSKELEKCEEILEWSE